MNITWNKELYPNKCKVIFDCNFGFASKNHVRNFSWQLFFLKITTQKNIKSVPDFLKNWKQSIFQN